MKWEYILGASTIKATLNTHIHTLSLLGTILFSHSSTSMFLVDWRKAEKQKVTHQTTREHTDSSMCKLGTVKPFSVLPCWVSSVGNKAAWTVEYNEHSLG